MHVLERGLSARLGKPCEIMELQASTSFADGGVASERPPHVDGLPSSLALKFDDLFIATFALVGNAVVTFGETKLTRFRNGTVILDALPLSDAAHELVVCEKDAYVWFGC